MKLLVCGGRDFDDRPALAKWMNEVIGPTTSKDHVVIIQGGARGADGLARRIADQAGVRTVTFDADWDRYGKKAGPIRNQRMLDEGKPDVVLAAPGGRGTADMVNRALKAGVPVVDKRSEVVGLDALWAARNMGANDGPAQPPSDICQMTAPAKSAP